MAAPSRRGGGDDGLGTRDGRGGVGDAGQGGDYSDCAGGVGTAGVPVEVDGVWGAQQAGTRHSQDAPAERHRPNLTHR